MRRSQCDFLEVEGADELAQGNFARKAMRSTSAIATTIPESGDAYFGNSNPTIRQDGSLSAEGLARQNIQASDACTRFEASTKVCCRVEWSLISPDKRRFSFEEGMGAHSKSESVIFQSFAK